MAQLVSLQTLLTYLTLISVPVGVLYHILTLRNQNRTRQAQLFMQIYNRCTDPEFHQNYIEVTSREWNDTADYAEKYGPQSDPKAEPRRRSIAFYFEGVGVLVYRKLIDITLVDDLMSSLIMDYWDKYGPAMVEWRKQFNKPQAEEWTEYLYNKIQKVAKRQHPELKT